MTPKKFVALLSEMRFRHVFNPYSDICPEFDFPDANLRRQKNLIAILECVLDSKTKTLWVARDLGYRGGRRTGLALTDEAHLDKLNHLFNGVSVEKVTVGPIVKERTASVIWNMMEAVGEPVLMWNVFPFHPHEPGKPFSNRSHTRMERDLSRPIFDALLKMISPEQLVSIGQDAKKMLGEVDVPVSAVRHPSYGGQREFESGIREIYGLSTENHRPPENIYQSSFSVA